MKLLYLMWLLNSQPCGILILLAFLKSSPKILQLGIEPRFLRPQRTVLPLDD